MTVLASLFQCLRISIEYDPNLYVLLIITIKGRFDYYSKPRLKRWEKKYCTYSQTTICSIRSTSPQSCHRRSFVQFCQRSPPKPWFIKEKKKRKKRNKCKDCQTFFKNTFFFKNACLNSLPHLSCGRASPLPSASWASAGTRCAPAASLCPPCKATVGNQRASATTSLALPHQRGRREKKKKKKPLRLTGWGARTPHLSCPCTLSRVWSPASEGSCPPSCRATPASKVRRCAPTRRSRASAGKSCRISCDNQPKKKQKKTERLIKRSA